MTGEWRPIILTPEEAMGHAESGEYPPGIKEDDIVFISYDMRLKDGLLADRDRSIFEDMRAGRTIPIEKAGIGGPVEIDDEDDPEVNAAKTFELLISQAARSKEKQTISLAAWMDQEAAEYVYRLRVEQRGSWRYVAGKTAERYGMPWGEDQPTGMMLCEIAAGRWYHEDYMEPPWN